MAKNQNLSKQLGDYLNKRNQRETDVHKASLELESLLFAEVGLVWELANEEEPFQWAWLRNWASYFLPKEAFEWIKAGIFEPKEAYQMKQGGQSPADTVQADREKKEVARQFSDWLKANHQRVKEEEREETSISCISCGSSWEENVADQLDEEGFCPICRLERAVSSFIREELGDEEEKELTEMLDLPCSFWVGKGFSPEEAMNRIKTGVFNPNEALELRKTERSQGDQTEGRIEQ